MIELLFVTCMSGAISQGETCQERSLVFTDVTPMTCLMAAQPHLAEWVVTHPGHRIASWKCRPVQLSEREA
ncbi:hypothetical protein [Citreimonas sp.]|uniref:hypothetical protein n=1 Tax=Citreimonas sp. TaxID=3036715 RepID=UPI0035C7D3AF